MSQRGRRWQYDGALHAGYVRLHAWQHKPAPATHIHPPPPPHTRNTYCFSTTTTVTWTHLNITLQVHCLSCCIHTDWHTSIVCGTREGCGTQATNPNGAGDTNVTRKVVQMWYSTFITRCERDGSSRCGVWTPDKTIDKCGTMPLSHFGIFRYH